MKEYFITNSKQRIRLNSTKYPTTYNLIGLICFILIIANNFSLSLQTNPSGEGNFYQNIINQRETGSNKFESKAISPSVIGRFSCDSNIKLNTVRQEVMNNNNYRK